jgi:2-oxoglutarate dehydrogenase E1 component
MGSGSESLPSHNLPFVEEMYDRFLEDENAVDESWRSYFRSLGERVRPAAPAFQPRSIFSPRGNGAPAAAGFTESERRLGQDARQDRVRQLVQAYRNRGHVFARLDPLGIRPSAPAPHFPLEKFGLDGSDLDKTFTAGGLRGTLREIVSHLEETYCRTIGVELAHIEDTAILGWLEERMESTQNHVDLDESSQLQILTKLTDAEIFEQFLHTSFVGAKRFSLEGAESFIPMMELIIARAAKHDVREIVIGMAHRGRLNVLANVMGMPAREIFAEFADEDPNLYIGRGDVKYHLGYSSDREVDGKPMHLTLAFNPSHLEFVNSVVQGRTRAKQDRRGDEQRREVMPIVVHGDAAVAGQGIVAELLNMANLQGYGVGGTVHIVVNNQVGFTTDPDESRSTRYATDIAKMLQVPIFHVNGEDPESVVQVVQLAVDFRAKFGQDVVIDLYSYRKHGHNESDEPSFTQPQVYKVIHEHPSIRDQYVRKLVEMGHLTRERADAIAQDRRKRLDQQLAEARNGHKRRRPSAMAGLWAKYAGGYDRDVPEAETRLPVDELRGLAERLAAVPEGFTPHPKIVRLLDQRRDMAHGKRPLDWGMGEALAFASLLGGGTRVRLSGQDVERGTFSHRHSVLHDYQTNAEYVPLNHVRDGQARYEVRNSPLSETSVLGFKYGYSLDTPDGLTIWEAQFGDFANAAQVIIDQFIASGEDKWHRLSGVTLLLPHGYEGQGPEHSSARLDRWLALCAEDNMQVANVTTPAQIFHLLRRQVVRPYRKPLVVMSPKSLLRNPEAVSSLEDLASGSFQRVMADPLFASGDNDPAQVGRVLLCTGKIYYELAAERAKAGRKDVAIVRVEQLYPTPLAEIEAQLARFPNMSELVWVQEESRNHGAWLHMWSQLTQSGILRVPLAHVTRPASASPATGSGSSHKLEQRRLLEAAFAPMKYPTP